MANRRKSKRKTLPRFRIKKICKKELSPEYRQSGLIAFRRVALKKQPLWKLMAEEKLRETISAWSLDTNYVKEFKEGVPPSGWQGVIFICNPTKEKVIINLSLLYAESDFKRDVEKQKSLIENFDRGIGKHGWSQSEVVIEKSDVSIDDIYCLGGFSSTPEEIGKTVWGRPPTEKEISWMYQILNKEGEDFGAWWIEGEAKDRVIEKIRLETPRLKEIYKQQKKMKK